MNEYQALQTLNLNSNSSFNEIKYAYRKLALELHPDKNSDEVDGKKFKKVTSAYHVLKNNNKKINSNGNVSTNWRNNKSQSKTEQNFRKKKPQWGADPQQKTPEEDWGRFTKDFEESNPNFWKKYEEEFWKKYDVRKNSDKSYEKKNESKGQAESEINFSTEVDPTLCIGCCSCETIAPEVFVIDKRTKMNPKSKVYNQRGTGFKKIMSAAETCPTKAIKVEDIDLKKILYPW